MAAKVRLVTVMARPMSLWIDFVLSYITPVHASTVLHSPCASQVPGSDLGCEIVYFIFTVDDSVLSDSGMIHLFRLNSFVTLCSPMLLNFSRSQYP